MLEILFSDSACGSLKMAQHYGRGEYSSACMNVCVLHSDGRKPTKAERKAAQQEAEEKARLAWESAVPLGGKSSDIFSLTLALNIGDITEEDADINRQQVLERLFGVTLKDEACEAAQKLNPADRLKTIRQRAAEGEPLRIWYSDQPDDMCGLYWFMAQLTQWEMGDLQIVTVKLPEWEAAGNNVVQRSGWGELAPGDWHRYIPLQKPMPATLMQCYAHRWRALQTGNAPLRAVLNGQLVGVPETFYDHFILREIEAEDETFKEANVIGRVLGKYQLGIGDAWIALRIEEMIQAEKFKVVSSAGKDMPSYRRTLKKCM